MLKLDPLQAFVEVVRAGGFASAARRIGMPRSTISLQVQALEASVGTRLLKRSTRTVTLTDDGRRLYEQAGSAIETLKEAMDALRVEPGVLSGLIRLTAPADLPTERLAETMTEFAREYPHVRFEVTLTNATLDLVAENVDIAIRVGTSGSETVERRLAEIEWCFCAATAWIAQYGEPTAMSDVSAFISPPKRLRHYLEQRVLGGASLPPPAIEVDSHILAKNLIRSGFGVGLIPVGLCDDFLSSGEARPVLREAISGGTRLVMAFPTRADMIPRVRIFADKLLSNF